MTKTITTTYYTFKELQEKGNTEAVKVASDIITDRLLDNLVNFYFNEFKTSVEEFGKIFNCEISDWSYSPFERSHITLDVDGYANLTNEEKKEAIKEYNELDKDNCPLTGCYTDVYMLEAVKAIAGKELTFNKATMALKDACDDALYNYNNDEVKDLYDIERIANYAEANDMYFDKDGNLE